jgi:hypothetical protein
MPWQNVPLDNLSYFLHLVPKLGGQPKLRDLGKADAVSAVKKRKLETSGRALVFPKRSYTRRIKPSEERVSLLLSKQSDSTFSATLSNQVLQPCSQPSLTTDQLPSQDLVGEVSLDTASPPLLVSADWERLFQDLSSTDLLPL